MTQRALLVLADGTFFEGRAFGALNVESQGELVFSTSMTGYVELLTDPSYCRQILVLTYAEIGNYGVTLSDVESNRIQTAGLVVRELSPVASNWRSEYSLDDWMKRENRPGICGIDTRALVRHLRGVGAQMSILSTKQDANVRDLHTRARALPGMEGRELVSEVATEEPFEYKSGLIDVDGSEIEPMPSRFHVVALDFGVKRNMLRLLVHLGCRVTVLPAYASASDVLYYKPDGLFLTNGPGDPQTVTKGIDTVRQLLGILPIFGICMGHQVLSLAAGGKTYKLKFGHRGANQPVMDEDGRVLITSQNHGFAVSNVNVSGGLRRTQINLSDDTTEGVSLLDKWAFGVQYHPEGAPGPHDARIHFSQFVSMMEAWKIKHGFAVVDQAKVSQTDAI